MLNRDPDWSSIYWESQSSLLQYDDRFTSKNFGSLFMGTIKQRIYRIQQEHNINNITTARQAIILFNSNIDPDKTEPIKKLEEFLPYPTIWKLFTEEIEITKFTARQLVESYPYLPDNIKDIISDEYNLCRMILDI